MKEYHINLRDKSLGSFSIEQLKETKIEPDSIVWYEGLADWLPVDEVEELRGLIKSTPPPIPRSAKKKVVHAPFYLILGILGFVITYQFTDGLRITSKILFAIFSFPMDVGSNGNTILLLIVRAVAAWFVIGTMKTYKRPVLLWGVFGFLFPALSFFVVSFVSSKNVDD